MAKSNRRQEILRELAGMLQAHPGGRITTAALAQQVGVSEAALYRHFPSKAKMLDGLIEYAEQTLFDRIGQIMQEQDSAALRCHHIVLLLLTFVERNPGFARLFAGDALQGENRAFAQPRMPIAGPHRNPITPNPQGTSRPAGRATELPSESYRQPHAGTGGRSYPTICALKFSPVTYQWLARAVGLDRTERFYRARELGF